MFSTKDSGEVMPDLPGHLTGSTCSTGGFRGGGVAKVA